MWSAGPTRKRPHRSAAATVKSYAYAQSDSDDDPSTHETSKPSRRTFTFESNLQLWIKHLSALHREETKKVPYRTRRCVPVGMSAKNSRKLTFSRQFNEKKRHLEQSTSSPKSRAVKVRVTPVRIARRLPR